MSIFYRSFAHLHQINCKLVNWKETFHHFYISQIITFLTAPVLMQFFKWIVEKGKGFQNAGKMHAFIFPLYVLKIFKKLYFSDKA